MFSSVFMKIQNYHSIVAEKKKRVIFWKRKYYEKNSDTWVPQKKLSSAELLPESGRNSALLCLSNSINISKVDDVLRIIQEGLFFKLRIGTLQPCLQ